MKRLNEALLFVILFVGVAACRTPLNIEKDPFYESFFGKTSLIMTKEEIEIYKHIPDKESKEEFIREFWQIRDPDPGTEENENKIEFEIEGKKLTGNYVLVHFKKGGEKNWLLLKVGK